MDYTIFLISLLSAVTSTEAIDLHSFTCSSAKEGGQSYVTLKWYDVTTVKVKKDGRDVLICMSNQKHCELFQPFGPNVRLSQSKDKDKDGLITLVIQIHRATRKGANPTSGVWTLAQVGSHNKQLDANCIVYAMEKRLDLLSCRNRCDHYKASLIDDKHGLCIHLYKLYILLFC